MSTFDNKKPANRRDFLGKIAGTAALMGIGNLAAVASPIAAHSGHGPVGTFADPEEWFRSNVKGKHKIVVDAAEPDSMHTFGAPKVFQLSNAEVGISANELTTILVLRSEAFIYALDDSIWAKYEFGKQFKINDPRTDAIATRNPYWQTKPDDFKFPGFGAVAIGIKDQQANGVLICLCNVAITVHSAAAAAQTKQDETAVKKEWLNAIIPGIQLMPSGVWALTKAQEYGCGYVPG